MKSEIGYLLFLLLVYVLPAIFLFWAARGRNRSPLWALWAITGLVVWIAFFYLFYKKPKVLKARALRLALHTRGIPFLL